MRIAVLGAGNIGLAVAAYLCHAGHQVALWSPSGASTAALGGAQRPLCYTGVVEGVASPEIAPDLPAALRRADAVFVALPANAHASVLGQLGRQIDPGQTVILSASSSVGALLLDREQAARGLRNTIAAFGSTPLTARREAPTRVRILTQRKLLDMAALPQERGAQALALCTALFGAHFRLNGDILTMSLANVNPIAHGALALCNITRMERAENWPQYHHMTPYVARLIKAMDAERIALGAAAGNAPGAIDAHFHNSFGVPQTDLATMAAEIHRRRGGPPGPTDPLHRYVLEDAPFGLAFHAALARVLAVPVPVTQAVLTLLCTLYGRDFTQENDVLQTLGFDRLERPQLLALVRNGYPRA